MLHPANQNTESLYDLCEERGPDEDLDKEEGLDPDEEEGLDEANKKQHTHRLIGQKRKTVKF
jgi:hypothetical protein